MKIIDLFSGIGGFSLGFQRAGYQFTEHYFSEIDKQAIANYKYNFPHAKYIGDITTLHGGDFTDIDIITFGSPCQDFSLAGRRAGLKGTKSSLIAHAIALIAQLRPSVFVWENVKGAFSSNARADFWAIIQAFANIGGYRLEWQLLNTSWVLPQNRERIYLVGHLAGRSIPGVFPFGENDKLLDRKTREKGWRGGNFKSSLARTITARYSKMGSYDTYIVPKVAATLTGGGHSGGLHSDMTVVQLNPSKESNGRQPFQQNRVFDERGISPALTRHNSNYAISRMRRLTEIECERLQGFPDNFTQYGDYNGRIRRISKTQRYKLIGNAVTVDIVELIAKRLKFIVDEFTPYTQEKLV
nr:MAG TPA: Cytosine specific methyltransferase [Caudoviricetes sp.]